jgi:hypothetical protein
VASRRSGGLCSRAQVVPTLPLCSCGYSEEQRSADTVTARRPLSPLASHAGPGGAGAFPPVAAGPLPGPGRADGAQLPGPAGGQGHHRGLGPGHRGGPDHAPAGGRKANPRDLTPGPRRLTGIEMAARQRRFPRLAARSWRPDRMTGRSPAGWERRTWTWLTGLRRRSRCTRTATSATGGMQPVQPRGRIVAEPAPPLSGAYRSPPVAFAGCVRVPPTGFEPAHTAPESVAVYVPDQRKRALRCRTRARIGRGPPAQDTGSAGERGNTPDRRSGSGCCACVSALGKRVTNR